MKLEIGKKYRWKSCNAGEWIKVLDIGRIDVWGITNTGMKMAYLLDSDWVEYQDPKPTRKVKMAPALVAGTTSFYKSSGLYTSRKHAENCLAKIIQWPSHPDDLKEYEIPVEEKK